MPKSLSSVINFFQSFLLNWCLNPNQTDVWMPCQDWGVASAATSIYLGAGTNICSKIIFPQKLASILTHFAPFSEFFFQKLQKNGENCKSFKKLLKMSENSKFCNFWAISTCNTSKERIFLIKFNYTEKKYDLFEIFLKKSNFSDFFFKFDADHLSLSVSFSNL